MEKVCKKLDEKNNNSGAAFRSPMDSVGKLAAGKLKEAKHPYTQALLRSVFPLREKGTHTVQTLEGEIPSPVNLPTGCPFQDRCCECMDHGCRETMAPLKKQGIQHYAACHLLDDEVQETAQS